jgi:prepilin-type N-terminal cleavage/methylation domain-containing protein
MNTDDGFTLVETLVALAVAATATLLIGGAYLAVTRAVWVWQDDIRLAGALHVGLERLAVDLYEATELVVSDSSAVIRLAGGDTVAYAVHDGVLLRDSRPMHDSTLAAVLRIEGDLAVAGLFRVHLRLNGRRRSSEGELAIVPRRPPPWPPVDRQIHPSP